MVVRLAVSAPGLVRRLVLMGTPLDTTPGSMSLVPSDVDDRFRSALKAGELERAMHYFVATVVSDPDTGEPIFTATAEFCEILRRFVRTGNVSHERSPFA